MAREETVLASNRKARHDYEILDTFEAGIVLTGTEVKSARQGQIQLKDSYVEVRGGDAYLVGVHISPYSHGDRDNHEPGRDRKLLLQRRELDRLYGQSQIRGLTIIPLNVHLRGNWIKLDIAIARGKKLYDKRDRERRKIQEEEMQRAIEDYV